MSLIRCPFCQSVHVQQTDSGNPNFNYFEQLQRCISPTQMAMFGMQVAKKAGVSPFIGAAIGVVIGGVLVVISQYCFEKYYTDAVHYVCLDCQQTFAWAK
ncbi:hypothetical protein N5I27_02850 [Acinetobacter johnsonii]|jgi:hypothetical protein|uniref:Uncharacterized protein n=1 Tax=Acinetobacter johnsonii TaxID=40214 RepID=A0AA42QNF3_ACIJO|nr:MULTISPECIES: hypothetical protein [Acinetobacter]MDH1364675.1 hypothetical protein [Acinetobacter johnsonii]MDH1437367.1 hypothetical protein [Acinetobacter johnsonii]MDH1726059.1 hypothetical protein [Acinetobacter johnsonii]NWK59067.1 hypothetical protein [Acinetobacter sp. SwsAc2]HAE63762.1 hypothetical protein [Acinetobacter johnsonii]